MVSKERIFEILEKGRPNDPMSIGCDVFLSVLIIINVIAVCLETVEALNTAYRSTFQFIEIVSVIIFAGEYGLRIWSRPVPAASGFLASQKPRLAYVFSFSGIIDLLAILPTILAPLMPGVDLRWIRFLRIMRLLKFSRYNSALEDLIIAIKSEIRSFIAAVYLLVLAIFISSALIYVLERDIQPEHFGSMPSAMWWTIVTLTTVGYGDVVPVTVFGKVIATLTAFSGVCVVALITGIVASSFNNQMTIRRNQVEAEVHSALSDGIITTDEQQSIKELCAQLNISESDAAVIIDYVSKDRE